jgi:hypothetical protein
VGDPVPLTHAWSLLHQTYLLMRETGRWLERHHPDRDELYPSIESAARPGVGQRKKNVGEPNLSVEPGLPDCSQSACGLTPMPTSAGKQLARSPGMTYRHTRGET